MTGFALISMKGRDHVLPERASYIGRANGPLPRAPLSNPWTVADHGMAALTKYRLHLARAVLDRDAAIVGEIVRLTDLVQPLGAEPRSTSLACWCVERPAAPTCLLPPKPDRGCHGDDVASIAMQLGPQLRRWSRASAAEWPALVRERFGQAPLAAIVFEAFGQRALLEIAELEREVEAGMPAWMRR